MRPHQLRALIATAEHGSIRAAARSVYLSQAALTKAIKELEEDMGTALIVRTTHGVQLTESGKALYAHSLAIVAEMRGAREDIERVKGASSGMVTAAVSPVSSVTLLPAAYRAFRRRMPDTRVDFQEANLLHSIPRLREGAIDFVIAGGSTSDSRDEFATIELFTDQLVLGCRRGHPCEHAQSIADLEGVDWILYSASPQFTDAWDDTLAEQGVAVPRRVVRCASLTPIMTLVTETDAIVAMPSRMLQAAWIGGPLTRLHVKEHLPTLSITIYTRRTSPLSPAAQVLIECFQDASREYLESLGEVASAPQPGPVMP